MTLHEQLIVVITEKLLIGGILGAVALYINSLLEKRKAADELKRAFAADRVKSYQALWAATARPLDEDSRATVRDGLTSWYADGGALFLSFAAAREFFRVKQLLKDRGSLLDITAALSRLRTELKHDCGSYSRDEADTQIPEAA